MIADEISQIADDDEDDHLLYNEESVVKTDPNRAVYNYDTFSYVEKTPPCSAIPVQAPKTVLYQPKPKKIFNKPEYSSPAKRRPKEVERKPKLPEELRYNSYFNQESTHDRLFQDSKRLNDTMRTTAQYYKYVMFVLT